MPVHDVNDRPMEKSVGRAMNTTTTKVGMPTMSARVSRSRRLKGL